MPSTPRLILQMSTLLVVAFLVSVWSNALSGPSRRLAPMGVLPKAAPPPALPAPSPTPDPTPSQHAAPEAPAPSVAKPTLRFEWKAGEPTREISSQEAAEAFRQGIPFLDARRTEDYQAGHIRGALAMPVWEADMDERLTRFDASGHPLKDPVVLYCSGGDCQDSELLASKLLALGYRHLLIYRGGYPDWTTKGRPIHRGVQP